MIRRSITSRRNSHCCNPCEIIRTAATANGTQCPLSAVRTVHSALSSYCRSGCGAGQQHQANTVLLSVRGLCPFKPDHLPWHFVSLKRRESGAFRPVVTLSFWPWLLILLFVIVPVHFSCTPPLFRTGPDDTGTISSRFSDFLSETGISQGYGSVEFSIDGERHKGFFDLHCRNDTLLDATFYSPLGSELASVTAGKDSGTVSFNGKTAKLSLDQKLDTLAFPWSRHLRFGDLVTSLTGRVLSGYYSLSLPPDIQTVRGFTKELLWETASERISLIFSRRLRRLKRSVYIYHADSLYGYSIIYDSFSHGIARCISFRVDDLNYFLIKYDRFKLE